MNSRLGKMYLQSLTRHFNFCSKKIIVRIVLSGTFVPENRQVASLWDGLCVAWAVTCLKLPDSEDLHYQQDNREQGNNGNGDPDQHLETDTDSMFTHNAFVRCNERHEDQQDRQH